MAYLTYAQAVAALRSEGAFHFDPIRCASADGYFDGAEGRRNQGADYRGVATARGYFNSNEARRAYAAAYSQGEERRAVRRARGW